jgi:hypothetical protein
MHTGVPSDDAKAMVFDPKHGGRVVAEMIVSPTEQTYITVKYWGGIGVANGSAIHGVRDTEHWSHRLPIIAYSLACRIPLVQSQSPCYTITRT